MVSDEEKIPRVGSTRAASDSVISQRNADATLELFDELDGDIEPLSPDVSKKLKAKLYWRLISLLMMLNLWLYIDKATLSYATLLGIQEEVGFTDNEFNDLYTIFYVGYIIAQIPGHYLMQRVPLGKFVAVSVFLWSVLIFLHCTVSSFGGLVPLRFFLGMTEACMVPAMEITMGMFFTPQEYTEVQPLWWISCMGCPIPAGFIAYGLLWSDSAVIRPWKYFMILTGGVTLLLAIACWIYYPNNPAQAQFLSKEERAQVIRKVHEATRSSIEQKTFKPAQARETVRDPVSWLFLLASLCLMISNNLQYQQNLLFLKIGVSNLGSTLVSAVGGGVATISCIIAAVMLKYLPNKGAYIGVFFCLPAIACGVGMVALPWTNTLGLLACLTLGGNTFGVTYIIILGWANSSSAGYTKKLIRNVFFMIGYGVANIIAPQIWIESDGPRYYGAWAAQIVVSWTFTPVILLVIRWTLDKRNKERAVWIAEQHAVGNEGQGYVEKRTEDGEMVKEKVDVAFLDLTDLENKFFIYPL